MSVMKKALKPVASELMHTKQTCHTHCYLLSSRLYCRFWNLTKSTAVALADFTAGREFHPAPKMFMKL